MRGSISKQALHDDYFNNAKFSHKKTIGKLPIEKKSYTAKSAEEFFKVCYDI